MTKDPNKNRNEEDFKQQIAILKEVAEVMKKYGLPPILYGGVALGIVRDGDFIPWDFDGDFFVDIKRCLGKATQIAADLKHLGYTDVKTWDGKKDWKVGCEKHDYHIDIHGFFRKGKLFISKRKRSNGKYSVYRFPAKYMDNLQTVEFRGYKFQIPKDADGFFTHMYGDWQKPKRTVKHSEYLTSRFKKVVKK